MPKICVHAVVNGQTVCVYLVCSGGAIFSHWKVIDFGQRGTEQEKRGQIEVNWCERREEVNGREMCAQAGRGSQLGCCCKLPKSFLLRRARCIAEQFFPAKWCVHSSSFPASSLSSGQVCVCVCAIHFVQMSSIWSGDRSLTQCQLAKRGY